MRASHAVAVITFLALVLGCSSGGSNQLPNLPSKGDGTQGDSGGGTPDGAMSGDTASGGGNPGGDSGPQAGDDCDPPNQDACGQDLLCCPVGGNPREGGVFNACMMPEGSPPACP